jgi:lysyl-tRNA synthetase class II
MCENQPSSVDRLVMMLSGASIRQTLAFPFVRRGRR